MVSNLTGLTNATGIYDMAKFVNDVSNYNGISFFSMFLVVIWFIIFLVLKRNDVMDSFFAASFICFVLALMLSYIQLVSSIMIFPFMGLTLLTGFWIVKSRKY